MAELSFKEHYPSLSDLGLTSELLLAVADDSDSCGDIEALNVSKVTNKSMLELLDFLNRHSSCTCYTYWRWVSALLSRCKPKDKFPTIKSLRQSVLRLSSRLNKLKKMPSSDEKSRILTDFFNTEYDLPHVFAARGKVVVSHSSDESSCSSCAELRDSVDKSRKKAYAIHRNTQKRLKRREAVIKQQDTQLQESKQLIEGLQKKYLKTEEQVSLLKAKTDRLRHRASYWKTKYLVLSESNDSDDMCTFSEENRLKEQLQEEIRLLEQDNIELKDKVQEILSDATDSIATFEGGRYTDDVRTCCYELLSLNVSVNNVRSVIDSVLRNVAHKEAVRLPKKTTVCDMLLECLTVAQAQVAEELSQDDGIYHTLQSDGTTKHGQHFTTFDVATVETTFSLSLRHVFSGSAQNTLDTLIEILDDLDVVRKEFGETSVSSIIISKLKNTMSDRHAAEKLFSTILSEYRANILPDIVSGWEQMSEGEREQLTRMNNFFCGLHFLVSLADGAEETVKLWESTIEEGTDAPGGRSSSTQNFVRTACKAFHHRGSEQAGCSTHFRAYLRRKGISKIPLASFVGNRFNILFFDAGGIFLSQSTHDGLSAKLSWPPQSSFTVSSEGFKNTVRYCWLQGIRYH